jgi:hypothetical protein
MYLYVCVYVCVCVCIQLGQSFDDNLPVDGILKQGVLGRAQTR